MAQKAWRCSQCGTVNEPGTRACRECGKWPSLFDLQDSAIEEGETAQLEELSTFEQQPDFDPEAFEPEVFEPEGEPAERQGRFPRWAVTAIWVIGILVWILVQALGDRS